MVLLGVIVWVTPIPAGIVLVPAGLVILSSEFEWARSATDWLKQRTGPLGRALERAEQTAKVRAERRLGPKAESATSPRERA